VSECSRQRLIIPLSRADAALPSRSHCVGMSRY
jgi:hypothetical protein